MQTPQYLLKTLFVCFSFESGPNFKTIYILRKYSSIHNHVQRSLTKFFQNSIKTMVPVAERQVHKVQALIKASFFVQLLCNTGKHNQTAFLSFTANVAKQKQQISNYRKISNYVCLKGLGDFDEMLHVTISFHCRFHCK